MSSEIFTIAQTIGTGGGGLLALVLAIWLAIKAIALARSMLAHRSGNHRHPKLEQLRLICPIATGRRTLDDLHDAIVGLATGIDQLNGKQDNAATTTTNLSEAITDLRLEIASRATTRGD